MPSSDLSRERSGRANRLGASSLPPTQHSRVTCTSLRCIFGSGLSILRHRLAFRSSLYSQKWFPARSTPGWWQVSTSGGLSNDDHRGDRNLPARRDLRPGSLRLFHWNQRLLTIVGAIDVRWGGRTFGSPVVDGASATCHIF